MDPQAAPLIPTASLCLGFDRTPGVTSPTTSKSQQTSGRVEGGADGQPLPRTVLLATNTHCFWILQPKEVST